jgi:hypothetical protein
MLSYVGHCREHQQRSARNDHVVCGVRASRSRDKGAVRKVVVGVGVGVGSVLGLAAVTSGVVPWAMSTFGTVVPGVGTMHAVGGVAAKLQTTSIMLGSCKAAAAGGLVGAGLTQEKVRTSATYFGKVVASGTAKGARVLGHGVATVSPFVKQAATASSSFVGRGLCDGWNTLRSKL